MRSSDVAYVQFIAQDLTFTAYADVLEELPDGLDSVIGQHFMRALEVAPQFKIQSSALTNHHPETAQHVVLERPYLPIFKEQTAPEIDHMSFKVAKKLARNGSLMIAQVKPTIDAAAAAFIDSKQDFSTLPKDFRDLLASFSDI
jgi:hypothetical protein